MSVLAVRAILCAVVVINVKSQVVRTHHGQLRGNILKTVSGKDIHAFRGIPFAQPPVGDLRFQAPKPASSWTGIRNATADGPPCPQRSQKYGTTSEDCLYLNVYTGKLPDGEQFIPRPVIVFFHPGGFTSLTGNSNWAGPQYLLEHDVVFVTSNYRIGALGFLSTEDANLRGNYGLKDQVLVLRWVKENIAAFGGNPDSVTLTGYSSGSRSVFLHMLSPMSRGLFHRAIAMCSAPLKQYLLPAMEQARKQAEVLNCSSAETSKEINECLLTKSAETITGTIGGFREFAWDPILIFGPRIERDLGDGEERFLPADPEEMFAAGNFSHVPFMTGHTELEFAWKALQILRNDSWAHEMSVDYERVFPISFLYERGTNRSRYISQQLRKFYLNNQPITNASEQGLGQLYADGIINFAADRAVKLIANKNTAPVYFYKFSYPGKYSYIYDPPGKPYGVVHHDDLIYLIYNSISFPLLNSYEPEYQTMKKMTQMWFNFAITSNPTPTATQLLDNVIWEPFTVQNKKYLDIGSIWTMKIGLLAERMAVWDTLFPAPGSAGLQSG